MAGCKRQRPLEEEDISLTQPGQRNTDIEELLNTYSEAIASEWAKPDLVFSPPPPSTGKAPAPSPTPPVHVPKVPPPAAPAPAQALLPPFP